MESGRFLEGEGGRSDFDSTVLKHRADMSLWSSTRLASKVS